MLAHHNVTASQRPRPAPDPVGEALPNAPWGDDNAVTHLQQAHQAAAAYPGDAASQPDRPRSAIERPLGGALCVDCGPRFGSKQGLHVCACMPAAPQSDNLQDGACMCEGGKRGRHAPERHRSSQTEGAASVLQQSRSVPSNKRLCDISSASDAPVHSETRPSDMEELLQPRNSQKNTAQHRRPIVREGGDSAATFPYKEASNADLRHAGAKPLMAAPSAVIAEKGSCCVVAAEGAVQQLCTSLLAKPMRCIDMALLMGSPRLSRYLHAAMAALASDLPQRRTMPSSFKEMVPACMIGVPQTPTKSASESSCVAPPPEPAGVAANPPCMAAASSLQLPAGRTGDAGATQHHCSGSSTMCESSKGVKHTTACVKVASPAIPSELPSGLSDHNALDRSPKREQEAVASSLAFENPRLTDLRPHAAPSLHAFERDFMAAGRPALLKGVIDAWPAMSRFVYFSRHSIHRILTYALLNVSLAKHSSTRVKLRFGEQ